MEIYTLQDDITINGIYTFQYQEKGTDFLFPGERHDFWELIYIDKGFIYLLIDEKGYKVNQGELYFFGKKQNHIVWSDNKTAPCFLTISFDMDFADSGFFEHRKFDVDEEIRGIIKKMLDERLNAFEGNVTSGIMEKRSPGVKGSEQLIKLYLVEILLKFYRQGCNKSKSPVPSPVVQHKSENMIFNQAMDFIRSHLNERLFLRQICQSVHVSPSYINRIFRSVSGLSVIGQITSLKLEKAKEWIRESKLTLSEISDSLGFSSIHYFSRLFKLHYGISPSEYAKSIRL